MKCKAILTLLIDERSNTVNALEAHICYEIGELMKNMEIKEEEGDKKLYLEFE